MKKKIFFTLIILGVVIVSCGLLTQEETKTPLALQNLKSQKNTPTHTGTSETDTPLSDQPIKPIETDPNPTLPPHIISGYNIIELDQKIIDTAKNLNQDPTTFRILVKSDPRGGAVYRQLGMFVIVNPNGEEVFLPDEI